MSVEFVFNCLGIIEKLVLLLESHIGVVVQILNKLIHILLEALVVFIEGPVDPRSLAVSKPCLFNFVFFY